VIEDKSRTVISFGDHVNEARKPLADFEKRVKN
jgi:hypothetical protein